MRNHTFSDFAGAPKQAAPARKSAKDPLGKTFGLAGDGARENGILSDSASERIGGGWRNPAIED